MPSPPTTFKVASPLVAPPVKPFPAVTPVISPPDPHSTPLPVDFNICPDVPVLPPAVSEPVNVPAEIVLFVNVWDESIVAKVPLASGKVNVLKDVKLSGALKRIY